MDDVVENGPAWESGVRKGDVIVTVNDWLIVLMDRPQVTLSFQFSFSSFFDIVLSSFSLFSKLQHHSLISFKALPQHLDCMLCTQVKLEHNIYRHHLIIPALNKIIVNKLVHADFLKFALKFRKWEMKFFHACYVKRMGPLVKKKRHVSFSTFYYDLANFISQLWSLKISAKFLFLCRWNSPLRISCHDPGNVKLFIG